MVDDLYDELTLRRIDGGGLAVAARSRVGAGRRALGGGALLTAVSLGIKNAFEGRDVEAIVEELRPVDDDVLPAVSLLLVRDAPARSRALVRPWLL